MLAKPVALQSPFVSPLFWFRPRWSEARCHQTSSSQKHSRIGTSSNALLEKAGWRRCTSRAT
jgi:hypothetical protein